MFSFSWSQFCRIATLLCLGCLTVPGCSESSARGRGDAVRQDAKRLIREGKETFRYDTLGSESFWGGALRLHETIMGSELGGIGPGLSARAALDLGLKIDEDALQDRLRFGIREGNVDLDDPATTVELLRQNSVVGLTGFFEGHALRSIGIQCALCHSTVSNGLAPGIGERRDGWPNRDLDVGAIIAFAPNVDPFVDLLGVDDPTVRSVLRSWGPGRFDAHLLLDGKAFRPDGEPGAVLIPPAFGLAGVNFGTYTGWGGVSHWNALVGNLEMQGRGTFYDPRLDDPVRFPIAAANGFGDVRNDPDLVTDKLAALHFYQLALVAPEPPESSFDREAASRGRDLFNGRADCARCHVPPLFTEPGWNLHTPDEIGIDSFQADRSPSGAYRTTPLGGLFARQKGGFYHDGRFATLLEVLEHYDDVHALGLTGPEKSDLVEYLKSL